MVVIWVLLLFAETRLWAQSVGDGREGARWTLPSQILQPATNEPPLSHTHTLPARPPSVQGVPSCSLVKFPNQHRPTWLVHVGMLTRAIVATTIPPPLSPQPLFPSWPIFPPLFLGFCSFSFGRNPGSPPMGKGWGEREREGQAPQRPPGCFAEVTPTLMSPWRVPIRGP